MVTTPPQDDTKYKTTKHGCNGGDLDPRRHQRQNKTRLQQRRLRPMTTPRNIKRNWIPDEEVPISQDSEEPFHNRGGFPTPLIRWIFCIYTQTPLSSRTTSPTTPHTNYEHNLGTPPPTFFSINPTLQEYQQQYNTNYVPPQLPQPTIDAIDTAKVINRERNYRQQLAYVHTNITFHCCSPDLRCNQTDPCRSHQDYGEQGSNRPARNRVTPC